MAPELSVWWNAQKGIWCSDIGGKRRLLARGKKSKKQAKEQLKKILREQELLARSTGIAERFLDAAHTSLAKRTFQSYQYACQKVVDTASGTRTRLRCWTSMRSRP